MMIAVRDPGSHSAFPEANSNLQNAAPKMPAPFPHHYHTQLAWTGNDYCNMSAPPRASITGGSPPEFDGNDKHWAPEHLFTSSVALCLMLTFQSISKKSKLTLQSYKAECTCTVDRGDGGLQVTAVHMHIDITVGHVDEVERVRPLLETAKKYCLISNSIKAPVTIAATVTAVSQD
ncbi:MAG: OsmC family protein [Planctomycetes bacterium]|nr:OsmC family protein [Planctomycetota bacterium]